MLIQIFDGSDEPCHAAQADSLDECKAMLYKQLADEYCDAEEDMPAHISEANIIDFFARSQFDISIKQS